MNCTNITSDGCGHPETRHELLPNGSRGKCEFCSCEACVFTVFRADEDGNVRPPSVEISVEQSRDDEPTATFDTSDVDNDPERTKP